jgi:hypothetical protein
VGRRRLRWLIFLPAAILALAAPAKADVEPGLNAVGYTYEPTGIPLRVDDLYPTCGSEIENNINRNFNGEPFQNCGYDLFMIHYTGFITLPEHETIQFMVAADDGGTIQIADTEFGTWNVKGCSWSEQVSLDVEAGTYPLDGWFFEWGGGTCYMLAWNIDDVGWEIVPDEAFTQTPTAPTTTTTVPETTVPETTTTVEETTTTTTTTTTATTTTTQAPPPETTTTTEAPPPPTLPPTTTVPEPTTTVPESLPTYAPTTVPSTTVPPQTTVPQTTLPPTSVVTTTTAIPATTLPAPSTTSPPETTLPRVEAIANATPEQIISVVSDISTEEAAEVFAQIEVSDLTDEQQEALVAAVQEAPTEVREAFEEQVDIFKEGLDDYVPVGSNIPVGQRRTIVAIGAAITAAGAATRIRR